MHIRTAFGKIRHQLASLSSSRGTHRKLLSVGLVFILVAVTAWLVIGSSSFQSCVCRISGDDVHHQSEYSVRGRFAASGGYADCLGQYLQQNNGAVTAIATVVMAVFSGLLWATTKSLWVEAKDASLTAQKAAAAAEKSANAALGVELPRFVAANIHFFVRDINVDDGVHSCEVRATFLNHGRTEAVITQECLVWKLDSALSPKPRYPIHSVTKIDFGKVVGATQPVVMSCVFSVAAPVVEAIKTGQTILWVYGFIEYRDFLQKRHRTGFVGGFVPPAQAWAIDTPVGTFAQEGPPSYTYNQYEVEDE